MRQLSLKTDRRTQLIQITRQVQETLAESDGHGATAALIYVPHTTAGVTINEHIDPELLVDLESALERIVSDEWNWRHEDADGANGPSHARASLISPQVLVPLRDGKLALGTYQGIFFCEFDGPRERKIFVTLLH